MGGGAIGYLRTSSIIDVATNNVNIPKLSSRAFFSDSFYEQSSIYGAVVKRELEANLYLLRLAVLRL